MLQRLLIAILIAQSVFGYTTIPKRVPKHVPKTGSTTHTRKHGFLNSKLFDRNTLLLISQMIPQNYSSLGVELLDLDHVNCSSLNNLTFWESLSQEWTDVKLCYCIAGKHWNDTLLLNELIDYPLFLMENGFPNASLMLIQLGIPSQSDKVLRYAVKELMLSEFASSGYCFILRICQKLIDTMDERNYPAIIAAAVFRESTAMNHMDFILQYFPLPRGDIRNSIVIATIVGLFHRDFDGFLQGYDFLLQAIMLRNLHPFQILQTLYQYQYNYLIHRLAKMTCYQTLVMHLKRWNANFDFMAQNVVLIHRLKEAISIFDLEAINDQLWLDFGVKNVLSIKSPLYYRYTAKRLESMDFTFALNDLNDWILKCPIFEPLEPNCMSLYYFLEGIAIFDSTVAMKTAKDLGLLKNKAASMQLFSFVIHECAMGVWLANELKFKQFLVPSVSPNLGMWKHWSMIIGCPIFQ